MARRRLHGLERVLGTNALTSTAYGNVGSSIYYALGLVASYALGLTPLVFLITGVFFFLTAATYAEATAMYPEAGGSSSFARHAFNEAASFFAGWAQMLTYVATIAISAFFVPHYIGVLFWEPLRSSPADIVAGIGIIAILAAVNVLGVRESTGLNISLAFVDFLTQVLLVLIGFAVVFSPETLMDNVDLGVAPEWSDFLLAIPIAMLAYTGIETISNMAEEARDAARTIPASISRVRAAVFAIYFTLPAVALSALPVRQDPRTGEYGTLLGTTQEQGGYAGDPILGVVKAMDLGPLQGGIEIYVGLLAATILLLAANAGIIGVSRLVYSMGVHRQLPDRLRRLHASYRTPYVGILVFAGFAALTLVPGRENLLGAIYSFGALLSFTMAHVSVIRLRRRRPDVFRPYRGPGTVRWRGVEWPLFAVAGGLFTGVAWLVVVVLHVGVAIVGTAWLVLGLSVYAWYRRRQGLDLFSTHRVLLPRPAGEHEAEYESVLVHFDADEGYNPGLMATAIKLAARRRRGVHVLVTVAVPYSRPIDDPMADREAVGDTIAEQARVQGGGRVTAHVERVRAGQAGRRIIQEARDLRATAVVMGLPRRVPGATVFGKTLETVLAERPCRVIIESAPAQPRPPRTGRAPAEGVPAR